MLYKAGMTSKYQIWAAIIIMASLLRTATGKPNSLSPRPNIVLIMADDLGIGDIGCFGNDTIKTPNIDRMARDGVKLTQFLAAAAVCTPSRAAFMTGRYAVRSGLGGNDAFPVFISTAISGGLPPQETTFAEIAKQAGYKTALIGKWHLGLSEKTYGDNVHHPNNHGFDYFYGVPLSNMPEFSEGTEPIYLRYKPWIHSVVFSMISAGVVLMLILHHLNFVSKYIAFFSTSFIFIIVMSPYVVMTKSRLMNSLLMRNDVVVEQPIILNNLTQKLVREGTTFLEQNKDDGTPFLLLMSWLQVHTALHTSPEFKGHSQHGRYGDAVEEMDWAVGEILRKLKKLDLLENTFVLFTSDHGAHVDMRSSSGEREGGYNGIYKGGKVQGGMEGGIRVPTIVMWPGYVTPGHVISEPLSNMDIFATVAELVGQEVPSDRVIDAHSLVPTLKEETVISPHEFLFHWCADKIHAVRWRPREGNTVWKVRYTTPNWIPGTVDCHFMCPCGAHIFHDDPLVFDIQKDPKEEQPLSMNHPEYHRIFSVTKQAVNDHLQSIKPVEDQLTFWKSVWKLQLQPCCNFPYCSCIEE